MAVLSCRRDFVSCVWLLFVGSASGLPCEWHIDGWFTGRLNYTEFPWHFEIDPNCTQLWCSTLILGAIDDAGAKALATALERSPQLEELSLGYNSISDAGAQALAAAFKHVPRLRVLNLGWNSIGDVGTQALAAGFEFLPALSELNLFWNLIGPAGTTAIARALHRVPKLTHLNLAWNDVGNKGAGALATALSKQVPKLEELRLDWTSIGDAGAQHLGASLAGQTSLSFLRAKWNSFGPGGALALAKAAIQIDAARDDNGTVTMYGVPISAYEAARADNEDDVKVTSPLAGFTLESEDAIETSAVDATNVTVTAEVACPAAPLADDAISCATTPCYALVISNAKYARGPLDPRLFEVGVRAGKVLTGLGFAVREVHDATRKQLRDALRAYTAQLQTSVVSLVFFLGRGAISADQKSKSGGADNGRNATEGYLLSVDDKNSDKGVSVGHLLRAVEKRGPSINGLVAACTGDLAVIAPPPNSFVLFDRVAGVSSHSPVENGSTALLDALLDELEAGQGLLLEQILKRARRRSSSMIGTNHSAYEASAVTVDFVPNDGSISKQRPANIAAVKDSDTAAKSEPHEYV